LAAFVNVEEVAAELLAHCVEVTDAFFAHHVPPGRASDGWLPRAFAGHAVGADVRADVIFTLGHLAAAGVTEIAHQPIDSLIGALLAHVDGVATHSFFSYRIAETLLERGRFAENPLLASLTESQRANVGEACDSSSFIPLLDAGQLPRNYIAVLSRCGQARVRLGLISDSTVLDGLLDRLRALLASNPRHALDDSNDGSGRYDIYTADVWLFCEPLAAAIGAEWRAGMADALALVEQVVGADGTAVPWGRSTGALSIALTVELGAVAIARELGDSPDAWLRRAGDAAAAMRGWFGADGVVSAHQHRDQDRYRGPARRLQLTFDLLGKLAWSARTLHDAALHDRGASVTAARRSLAYPDVDALIEFDTTTTARLWAYRTRSLAFALPFVGAARSHYLPALHRPGLFEVPVDQDLPCWTPLVIANYQRHVAGGLPTTVAHAPDALTATWNEFVATTATATATFATDRDTSLAGRRVATWQVERRSIQLDDELNFDTAPDAIAFCVPEIAARPLIVEFSCDTPHAVNTIDVDGLAEWRSSWSQITRVHQLDLDPAPTLRYSVRVTPKLRIASTAHDHHYHRSLYTPMADRVVTRPSPLGSFADPTVPLDEIDVFHLHWPEWLAFDDLDEHRRIADRLDEAGIPVVWTAHNLTPHAKQPDRFDRVYALWAERVNAVIHHSHWGRAKLTERYAFAADVHHEVIPHGHFGGLWAETLARIDRAAVERALGFTPCALRIGIVGAPRSEKLVREFCAGFAASSRSDIQLAVWSRAHGEELADDPRIVASETYRGVDAATYATRLAACDLLALPFDPGGEMLATGTVGDAIGVGLPVLGSDWGFLVEYLGAARLSIGGATSAEVTAAIDSLRVEQVRAARAATLALQPEFDWSNIAERTLELLMNLTPRA
jgi:glycosyltransferase involved in cell wall biosynthesis